MNEDQFAGTARTIGGQVEEAVGSVARNPRIEGEGILEQVKGTAQSMFGDAKETVRDTYDRVAPVARDSVERVVAVTRENSFVALLAAAAVGFGLAVALRQDDRPTRGKSA